MAVLPQKDNFVSCRKSKTMKINGDDVKSFEHSLCASQATSVLLNCNAYDDCRSVDIIYLDFQKAFDKVPHMRLLTKLKAHGVTGYIHKWVENWLSENKD